MSSTSKSDAFEGYPIVLTADRTLFADYKLLMDGMVSSTQTTATPNFLMLGLLAPRVMSPTLRAHQAPLGLRRIEAALLADGFTDEDVAIIAPEEIERAIGGRTKIVGLSSGDPLGTAMNSTTAPAIEGGSICCASYFATLAAKARKCLTNDDAKIVFGGPGAWQLAESPKGRQELSIDYVLCGYCENEVAQVFRAIINGEEVEEVTHCKSYEPKDIRPIAGPTTMGVVEISRGCGLACTFCTLSKVPMRHLSEEIIVGDVKFNLSNGVENISLLSEDFFRYGSREKSQVDFDKLVSLLEKVRALDGLNVLQIDHANVASIAQLSEDQLKKIHSLITGGRQEEWVWVNLGIETACGSLLRKNGGGPKMRPYDDEKWPQVCQEQVQKLVRAGFFPLVSLVVGMPHETDDDVRKTIEWVESLGEGPYAVVPLLYAPINDSKAFTSNDMDALRWRLYRVSYYSTLKWMPKYIWQSGTYARVPLWKRCLLQFFGLGRIFLLKLKFAYRSWGWSR